MIYQLEIICYKGSKALAWNYGEEKFDLVCVFTAAALLSVVADDAQEEEAGAGFWSHVEKF